MRAFLYRLKSDRCGAAALEFALIGPSLILMLLGIFQVGLGMQNYNALRSATADTARYAVVNYQTSNRLTNAQLEAWARNVATRSPYNLSSDRLLVAVTTPGTQRIAGAAERTITMRYVIPSVVSIMGLGDITINYARPVFLLS